MTPLKWSLILILAGITLLGLPIGADSESSTEETKPSTAKDCRVHIEKALEQYWDQKDSTEVPNPALKQNLDTQQDIDDQEIEEQKSKLGGNSAEQNIEDDDDDEDDEDDNDENEQHLNTNESEVSEDEDEDDEDDDEDDDDDEEETVGNISAENDNNKDDGNDDDEDEDEEDDDDDDEEENESQIAKDEAKVDDTDDDDEDDDDEDTNSTSETSTNKQDNNNEEEDDDDDEDEDDENDDDDDEDSVTEPNSEPLQNVDKVKTEQEVKDAEKAETGELVKEENDDNDDDDEDEEENDDDDDDEDEEEDEPETNDTSVEQHVQNEASQNEIKIEIQVETDKVTGEADRASVRVASEFLDEKPSLDQPQASKVEEKTNLTVPDSSDDDDEEDEESGSETFTELDDFDDDSIENIYEDEDDDDDDSTSGVSYRSRDHIDVILGFDEIGTEYDKEDEKFAQNVFKDIKKIHLTQIKPMEMLYKFTDSTSRALGDAEIFNMPMLMFLGPWSAGKTSIINYLLGLERTPAALKTGTGVTDVDFTLISYGDQKRVVSGTELAADWRYAGLQKFGQGFLDHFRSVQLPHTLLKRITIVDTPGILENKKNAERGYSLSEAFQWFIDRSDAIYVVLDPTKVDIGGELGSVIDQLKGRDARFILNKADTIRRSDLMRVVGQLFWNLSPLMSSTEAPVIYAVSLTTKPYHPSAPAKFLSDQEKNFLYDMKSTLDKRVENRILYARRHAVRVRNHAKMVDCYLATYYRHKSIFSSKRNVAKQITENPREFNIFDGLGGMTNISRYDLPDPIAYKEFFKLHPLYDFKPLASTCSYFRGCPMDKLDLAISKDIPELLSKYKKMKLSESSPKQER